MRRFELKNILDNIEKPLDKIDTMYKLMDNENLNCQDIIGDVEHSVELLSDVTDEHIAQKKKRTISVEVVSQQKYYFFKTIIQLLVVNRIQRKLSLQHNLFSVLQKKKIRKKSGDTRC